MTFLLLPRAGHWVDNQPGQAVNNSRHGLSFVSPDNPWQKLPHTPCS